MAIRVLITGAAGFVGRHLETYLAEKDLEIYGLDRPKIAKPKDWSGEWIEGDILDNHQVFSLIRDLKPDYVFHLAALMGSDAIEELLAVNVIGTKYVLEALSVLRPEARVLVAGSSSEYGVPMNGVPIREDHALRPINCYGVSKVAQSLLARQYAYGQGLGVVRTRTFNLTGPGEPEGMVCSSFSSQIVKIEQGRCPPVLKTGNLDTLRDFVDVRDAVRAYWLIIQRGEPGQVYNVCSGVAAAIRDVLTTLLECASVKVEVQGAPDRERKWDIPVQVGDFRLLQQVTGWQPKISLRQSLNDNLNYWRKKEAGADRSQGGGPS